MSETLRLHQLDASVRPAFEDLLREQSLCDNLASNIIQWRYFDQPEEYRAVTWLVMEHDRCVAMLDSMLRPYLLDGKRILVRETADWYCVPRLRSRGIGLRLLLHMRMYPEPVLVMGGTEANVNILTRMPGWLTLPGATICILPLKARGLAANWVRRKWSSQEPLVRVIPQFLRVRHPRRIKSPSGQRATIKQLGRDDIITLPRAETPGLSQLLEQTHWAWLTSMPSEMAQPVAIEFFLDGVQVGLSLSQIEPTISGLDSKIMYLQATDQALLGWIVYETSKLLADHGVGFIRCCASTPGKIEALRQAGYIRLKDVTCHWWQRSAPVPSSVDVGYMSIDDSMPWVTLRRRLTA